jgi:Flp pilus assembly protein TadG
MTLFHLIGGGLGNSLSAANKLKSLTAFRSLTVAPKKLRGSERGNVVIESALVLVPLIVLIAGLVDVGLSIFLKATFEHAAREGARYAITYQLMTGYGHDESIKRNVVENSMGFLRTTNVDITYYDGNNPANVVSGTGSNGPGNIVVVSIARYTWNWIIPMFMNGRPGLTISAQSADRMEGLPAGQSPPAR